MTPFELNEGADSDNPDGSVKIVEMMKENPEITIPMMAESLRLTTRAVEKNVARLQAKGVVKRIGPDKGGHWEVIG